MKNACTIGLMASLLLLFKFALGQHPNAIARKGNDLYKSGKYKDAEARYRKSLEAKKSLNEANYNLGNTLLKQGKTAEATEVYKNTIASDGSPKLKQQAWHNLGAMHLKDKNWEEGAKAFSEALKLNPADEDSRYNLAYAKAMMKQAQQNNQNKDKKDKKKDNQDKNKDKQEGGENQDKNKDKNKDKNEQNKNQEESADKGKIKEQQMSKQDAERLLNALASKERDLQKKMNRKKNASPASAAQIEKDW